MKKLLLIPMIFLFILSGCKDTDPVISDAETESVFSWAPATETSNQPAYTHITEPVIPTTATTAPTEIPPSIPETLPPVDYLKLYAPVIENCKFIEYFDPNSLTLEERTEHDDYELATGFDLVMSSLGYALLDIDHDGVEELIIGCPTENVFGERGGHIIIALFGLEDGVPVKILQSHNRDRHYLYDGNRICRRGSSGAAHSTTEIYTLSNNQLILEECFWSNGLDENMDLLTYHSTDGSMDENDSTKISLEQYHELGAAISHKQQPLPPLVPVSE